MFSGSTARAAVIENYNGMKSSILLFRYMQKSSGFNNGHRYQTCVSETFIFSYSAVRTA